MHGAVTTTSTALLLLLLLVNLLYDRAVQAVDDTVEVKVDTMASAAVTSTGAAGAAGASEAPIVVLDDAWRPVLQKKLEAAIAKTGAELVTDWAALEAKDTPKEWLARVQAVVTHWHPHVGDVILTRLPNLRVVSYAQHTVTQHYDNNNGPSHYCSVPL